ncbi:MAG TPA: metallophosphoesterase, partial [Spirochaetes bacterium]|nr:metallophosphoesterase [Spirochaetota bacterium]
TGFVFAVISVTLFYYSLQPWVKAYSLKLLLYFIISAGVGLSLIAIYSLKTWLKPVNRSNKENQPNQSKRKFLAKAFLTSIVIGTPITYSLYNEKENIELVQFPLAFKELPPAFHGYRIVQLSDIHSSYSIREDYLNRVIQEVNQLNPDLLVLTGDYLTGKQDKKYFPELLRALSRLDKGMKKYAILGNHDFWTDASFVEKGLKESSIRVLRNEHCLIRQGDDFFYLTGVDDLSARKTDIEKASQNMPLDAFTILLSHHPDFIPTAADYRFNLMLSGHTHGGQIQMPLIGPIIVPSRFGRKYAQGLHKVKDTYLYVNRGIGVISPPIRFLCRPEITEITLIKEV